MARRVPMDPRNACVEMVGVDSPLLFATGHDEAIIGIVEREGVELVVYDASVVVKTLCKRDKMTRQEAEGFFAFNIAGAWIGEGTPLFLRPIQAR